MGVSEAAPAEDDRLLASRAGSQPAPAVDQSADGAGYPALFEAYLLRGAAVAREGLQATGAAPLDEHRRERCLHVLSFVLKLPAGWPAARDLLLGLAQHMEMLGYRQEWIDLLQRGVAAAETHGDMPAQAHLHLHLGILDLLVADYTPAAFHLETSEHLAAQVAAADPAGLPIWRNATARLADLAIQRGDYASAAQRARTLLAHAPAADPTHAAAHSVLGYVALQGGEAGAAIQHYAMAYELYCRAGNQRHMAQSLRDLGDAYVWFGQPDLGCAALTDAMERFAQLGDIYGEAIARMHLGLAHAAAGEVEAALACYAQCEKAFHRIGSRNWLAKLYNNRGLALQKAGDTAGALAAFTASLDLARALEDRAEAANTLDSRADLYMAQGEVARARMICEEALRELEPLAQPPTALVNGLRRKLERLGG